MIVEKCGCGRDIRYMTSNGGACNKHMRCLTYSELEAALAKANSLVMAYRAKRAVDGLNGRDWDASEHFKAESFIEQLEAPNQELNGAACRVQ